ncbi:MAG: hypothetical protein ACO1SX_14715, partial [Actinomycetota bacterium]
MVKANWPLVTAAGILALTLAPWGSGVPGAQAQEAPRSSYDFEDGTQGFSTLLLKAGQFGADAEGSLTVAKDLVHGGKGALSYIYKPEKETFRALLANTQLPAGTQSLSFWIRSNTRTQLILTLREEDDTVYEFPFFVPAHEWTQVTANLSEFRLGNNTSDENDKLDVGQVRALSIMDIANILVTLPAGAVATDLTSQRQIWLDDVKLTKERAPHAMGEVTVAGQKPFVLNNFENGAVDWVAARVTIGGNTPTFDIFPDTVSFKTLTEAAGPGGNKTPLEPGGKGLRIGYKRGPQEVYAFVRSVESADLRAADRLRLTMNMSQKSLLIVQIKEKDDSEYQHLIQPDNSVGWQNLDLALSSFTLGDNSKDENNYLDPDKIKE